MYLSLFVGKNTWFMSPFIRDNVRSDHSLGAWCVPCMVEKQLWDLPSGRQVKRSFLGESKVRNRICLTATNKSSLVLSGGAAELNCWQNLMCRFRASSVVIMIFSLSLSSFTASEHSPQIQRPPYLSFTRPMYACVQSSTNPQQQHFTDDTAASAVSAAISAAGNDFVSFKTFAAIPTNPLNNNYTNNNVWHRGTKGYTILAWYLLNLWNW